MSWLDFLPQAPPLNADSFAAPQRVPPMNQGGRPSGPQRLTGRQLRKVLLAGGAGPGIAAVREVNIEADCIPVPFVLAAAGAPGALQILVANAKPRVLLIFRSASTSLGTLFVGFGSTPDINNASLALIAGQQAIFDHRAPSNDVWLATDVGGTFGVVTYALAEFL